MQPRMMLGTLALVLGVSGVAYAGDNAAHHTDDGQASQSTDTGFASSVSRAQTKAMQRALTARNLYQGKIDGVWGAKTESALRNFQTQSGLEPTGELDEATANALGIDPAGPPGNAAQAMSGDNAAGSERQPVSGTDNEAPHAERAAQQPQAQAEREGTNLQLTSLSQEQAREMQQRLQLLGYYRGPVDGKVGEGTRAALQRYFQRQAELARQGVISNSAISLFGTDVNEVQPVSGQEQAPNAR